jgi:hypothetical protein
LRKGVSATPKRTAFPALPAEKQIYGKKDSTSKNKTGFKRSRKGAKKTNGSFVFCLLQGCCSKSAPKLSVPAVMCQQRTTSVPALKRHQRRCRCHHYRVINDQRPRCRHLSVINEVKNVGAVI